MTVEFSPFVTDVIAGTCGGAVQIVVGHPFDTVKVKLQSGASVMNGGAAGLRLGALGVARQTVLSEGVSGLFKGMGAPLATVSALNAVLFAANGALRGFARKITGVQEGGALSLQANALCGGGAGVFVALLACPTELIKCRLQSQQATGVFYAGPVDCVQKILRQRGLLGIYHGFASTLLREVPGGMAYFTAYETVKKVLTREGSQPAAATLMFAGGMAGVSFWSAVYPMDLIKTRIQTDSDSAPRYRGIIDCARQLYREGGIRGLYRVSYHSYESTDCNHPRGALVRNMRSSAWSRTEEESSTSHGTMVCVPSSVKREIKEYLLPRFHLGFVNIVELS